MPAPQEPQQQAPMEMTTTGVVSQQPAAEPQPDMSLRGGEEAGCEIRGAQPDSPVNDIPLVPFGPPPGPQLEQPVEAIEEDNVPDNAPPTPQNTTIEAPPRPSGGPRIPEIMPVLNPEQSQLPPIGSFAVPMLHRFK